MKPGLRTFSDESAIWVEHNSAGFRDRERTVQAAPGTLRVAVIGDSFVHGYFAPLEKMFTAFLEQELNRCAARPDRSIEVLSFGVFGYNTTQELLTYHLHAARYRPDIVVLALYTANDVFDNHPRLSSESAPRYVYQGDSLVLDNSFRNWLPKPPAAPWRRRVFDAMLERSRLFRVLKEYAERARDLAIAPPPDPVPEVAAAEAAIYQPPVMPELAEAWRNTEGVVQKFNDDVRANGSEFWLLTLYNLAQVDPDAAKRTALQASLGAETLFYPDRRLAAFARARNIPVISLAEPLAAYAAVNHVYLSGGGSPQVPLGEGHWNDIGASVAARLSAAELCRDSAALTGVLR